MEFAYDNASYTNNASERATANHSTNCDCEVPCLDLNQHGTQSKKTDSVTVEMAPSTDEKTTATASEGSPAPSTTEEKEKNPKPKQRKEKPKDVVTYRTHLTSLAHISVLVFVYMVIKLALRGDFVFFTWHPILMSVGWMFLMTEGFYAINKNNTYWRFKTTGGFRVKIHVIFLGIGYALAIAGFIIVYTNKNLNGKEHFVSWHGFFGLLGLICTFPPVINGTLLWYKKELSRFINRPRLIKFVHVLSGCLAFFFGALSLVLSVYTRWFGKKSYNSDYIFYTALVSVSFPLFWAIYGPAVKLTNVIKDYFSEDKED